MDSEFEHYHEFCGLCVGSEENKNLYGPQKELITWHWNLEITMTRIQDMMIKQKM